MSDISKAREAELAQQKASAAADHAARRRSALDEAWAHTGKEFKWPQDRDEAVTRLTQLASEGLLTDAERDNTLASLRVRPPEPTHEERRKAIEAQISGAPVDAKNMSPELFAAMWAAAGKRK